MAIMTLLSCCGLKEMGDLASHGKKERVVIDELRSYHRFKWSYDRETAVEALRSFITSVRSQHGFIAYDRPGRPPGDAGTLPSVRCGGIIFSEARRPGEDAETAQQRFYQAGYTQPLIDLIAEENLGTVHALPQFVNPNTGNMVYAYLWLVNDHRLSKWWQGEWKKMEEEKKAKEEVQK